MEVTEKKHWSKWWDFADFAFMFSPQIHWSWLEAPFQIDDLWGDQLNYFLRVISSLTHFSDIPSGSIYGIYGIYFGILTFFLASILEILYGIFSGIFSGHSICHVFGSRRGPVHPGHMARICSCQLETLTWQVGKNRIFPLLEISIVCPAGWVWLAICSSNKALFRTKITSACGCLWAIFVGAWRIF